MLTTFSYAIEKPKKKKMRRVNLKKHAMDHPTGSPGTEKKKNEKCSLVSMCVAVQVSVLV